jgi:hypothetical protein
LLCLVLVRVRVAFGTPVFGMDAGERAATLATVVNPELCLITEDLVFTEPYVDAGRTWPAPDGPVTKKNSAGAVGHPLTAPATKRSVSQFCAITRNTITGIGEPGPSALAAAESAAADPG